MSAKNKELIDQVNQAFLEGNMEKVLTYFTDDVHWEMIGTFDAHGKEAIRESMPDMEGQDPPKFTVDTVIAEGDRVVCMGEIKMTMPDGTPWEGAFCDSYLIRDGKVAELRSFGIEYKKEQDQLAMIQANTYLNFSGNTEEAFDFYKTVFGGEFSSVMRWKDMPGAQLPDEVGNKIMHISLPLGPNSILMATDSMEGFGNAPALKAGNNFHINLSVGSKEEADRLFTALSAGGGKTMPMEMSFWGSYFGMCTDKFGIQWMLGYDEPK